MLFMKGRQMKPEKISELLLGATRSRAKMFEYRVPAAYHINIKRDPATLFSISIGLLGDLAATINAGTENTSEARELKDRVRFSAQFFDAYFEGQFQRELDAYLLLVGAASYYLCDLPGSAAVLARRVPTPLPDLGCSGLDQFTAWLLRAEFSEYSSSTNGQFKPLISAIAAWMRTYLSTGQDEARLDVLAQSLRTAAYHNGTPRELLFADIASALAKKRQEHSAWHSLPVYSRQPLSTWANALRKQTFMRELWPAQRLLGENGMFRGVSGVVQMPTSAGKTRATELIIRSEFLSGRAELAIIVAPFRALCHEIRNSLVDAFKGEAVKVDELTDVFQPDFNIMEFLDGKQILVVTPEKLVYVLRHNPELADQVGVLIYDEGHQFDSGARGVTYELLVTALKSLIPRTIQTVLISAVIANAEAINEWLNGDGSVVVKGATLTPTSRSVAFTSWQDRLGRLEFVNTTDPESSEFFVPRLIETIKLKRKPRERTDKFFPTADYSPSVALYLGMKLSPSGSVAIFCGTKATVTGLCELAVDVVERDVPLDQPAMYSDRAEIERLTYLHKVNLGDKAPTTRSARAGIFAHHGNTPHGIRLAVEYAMRKGTARMVICTSTLAQGVNLPIRYLIVTSTQQGSERIKVRDFHNLIGRAGRSGMHTEGSILFANPELYDRRLSKDGNWRWDYVKTLLHPDKAEPCVSALLSVFKPLESDDGKYTINMDPVDLLKACLGKKSDMTKFLDGIVNRHASKNFTENGLRFQVEEKWRMITALESYLMAYWEESTAEQPVQELAKRTLANHLAKDAPAEQQQLLRLFEMLAANIAAKVPEPDRRRVFARTLFGVRDAISVEKWVIKNAEKLIEADSADVLFELIWPVVARHAQNANFRRCTEADALGDVARGWLNGESFFQLLEILNTWGARFGLGKKPRNPTIDHVVDICENALAFDGMLTLGAVAEMFEHLYPEEEAVAGNLRMLQKRIKYGVKEPEQVLAYELGFSDRVVAMEVAELLDGAISLEGARQELREERADLEAMMQKYPSYFHEIVAQVVS